MPRILRAILALAMPVALLAAGSTSATWHAPVGHAAAARVGSVRVIQRGLAVRPPGRRVRRGTVKMPLFSRYGLTTGRAERAAIDFRDGSVLQMNERTDAVLTSPTTTLLRSGEVDQVLAPGANHRIQTAAAVATAIGTNYLVRIIGRASYVMVQRGAVLVSNPYGSVVVKSNQGSLVIPGQAPQPAYPVDAGSATSWIGGLRPPALSENIALDSSGGRIVAFTSQYVARSSSDYGPFPFGLAANLIDGRLDVGWESNTGLTTNQSVTIAFKDGAIYPIAAILIDPAATQGDPADSALKDFAVRVSTTDAVDSAFTTVLQGTCARRDALQRFVLPPGTRARYLQLVARDNYGDPQRIAVAELEVVSPAR